MAKKSSSSKLTDQQELFCREYIKDLNGKQAAIRAGYKEKNAEVQASQLLSLLKVKEFVQGLMDKRSAKLEIDADDILRELQKIGYCDIRKLFDEKGNIKETKDWPDDIAACIASIEVEELIDNDTKVSLGFTKKVKFWSKPTCLELMGKHKKLFGDAANLNIHVHLAERVMKARLRKEQK